MSTASRVLVRFKTATASALRDLLVRVRRENVSGARSKWGDCELVSDEFLSEARRAGLAPVGRSFIVWGERSYDPAFAARRRIEPKSGQHQWVVIDGIIYDGTSDQFGDDEITISRDGDPRYHELRRFGHTFRTAGLEVYLNDPGKVPGIGPERGKKPSGNVIAKFTSPHGSYRYVAYVDGKAVAALQVVSRDKKTAVIANVYTDPSARRQGWASALLAQARRDFKKVEHASEDDLSEDGRAWRDRVKAASMWLDMAIDKMYPPVMEWVHRPSAGKGEVFEVYRSLSPREKAAYDADVRAAFTRAHGAKVVAYRYKERPRHMGGMSLTTEEPTYLSPDKYTAYEVDAGDVLVHWAQEGMPLGGRAFGHEKELILKPEANPRVVRTSERTNTMRTLGHRVAQRFVAANEKRAFILPYPPDEDRQGRPYDPEEEIEKGEAAVKDALPLAKKALSDLKALEADAKEVHRDGVKEIETFLEALQGLDAKKSAPFVAATHAALAKLKGDLWPSMLGYENGLSYMVKVLYELPKKLRAYLTKSKETEPVKKLDAAYKSFAVVSKKHHALQERFHAMKDVGYRIWHLIEYTEILVPRGYKNGWYVGKPFDTSNMEAYNDLWKEVRGVAQYMTIYEDKAEERFAGMVANLEEMAKLLDGMMNDYVRATYRDPDAVLKDKGRQSV